MRVEIRFSRYLATGDYRSRPGCRLAVHVCDGGCGLIDSTNAQTHKTNTPYTYTTSITLLLLHSDGVCVTDLRCTANSIIIPLYEERALGDIQSIFRKCISGKVCWTNNKIDCDAVTVYSVTIDDTLVGQGGTDTK